jgi:hypothetical protein
MNLHKAIALICTFSFLVSITTLASDFQTPRTSGLGGAGHAAPVLTDAVYQNPSYISMMPVLALGLNDLSYPGRGLPKSANGDEAFSNSYNVSAQNGSRDSWFQYGIGYSQGDFFSSVHLVFSKGFSDRFSMGIGTKVITPAGGTEERFVDGSLAVSGIATDWFRFSLILDNVLDSGKANGLSREFTLGTKFNLFSVLQLYLDPLWVSDSIFGQSGWGYELGAEFPFLDYFFLRTGIFKNANVPHEGLRGDGFGFGLGILMPFTSLDYAYTRVLGAVTTFAHHFSITFYL